MSKHTIDCEYCGNTYNPSELPSGVHICKHCVSCHGEEDMFYADMCCSKMHTEVTDLVKNGFTGEVDAANPPLLTKGDTDE